MVLNKHLMRVTVLSAIFFSLSLNMVYAQKIAVDEIVKELGTLETKVIKGPNGRYLINMGTIHNIKKGSLWTVYSTDEQVIDPATGKKLGVFPVPLAICKVTRVEKQFSEISVKCLKESCNITSGTTIERNREIKALFQDVNGSSYRLYELIRAGLPSLDWQGYQSIENSADVTPLPEGIVIVADKGSVTIWSGGEILSIYDEMSPPQPAFTQSTLPAAEAKKSVPKQETAAGPPGIMIPGLSTNLKIENYRAVTSLDRIVDSIGIMESDGTKEPYFIYLSNKTLYARAIESKKKYHYAYKGFGDVVNMSLGPNGLIALNIYVKHQGMESRILKFTKDEFTVLSKDIDYILEFLDMNGNGVNDSLIGQDFDVESFFGSGVFHFSMDGSGTITKHDPIYTPTDFNLIGAIMADLDQNKIKETAYYNLGGKLVVYEANKQKWESSSPFDPTKIMLIDDIINESNAPRNVPVRPESVLFRHDHLLYAAVPANQTGIWSIVGARSKNGGLGLLCPGNGTYAFRLLTSKFQGPVQSIFMYDNELYIAVVEGNIFTGHGKTHIIAVPMNVLKQSIK
jgi:hypothetical protein